MMDQFLLAAGLVMFVIVALLMYRVILGPSVMDRIVAVNAIGTTTAVLLVIIGALYHRVDMFVDFALTYALLNFIASLAVAKVFHRFKLVDRDPEDTP